MGCPKEEQQLDRGGTKTVSALPARKAPFPSCILVP